MDKTKSIIRIAILISLASVAMFCIFSSPVDDSKIWFTAFFVSKAIGVGTAISFSRLYRQWKANDAWIARYDKWCMEGMEK